MKKSTSCAIIGMYRTEQRKRSSVSMNNLNVDELQTQNEALRQSVIIMTVESWRLCAVLDRLLLSVDAKESQRYQSKVRWFLKKAMEALATAGLHISDYTGQVYDPGIPATPINLEDFESTDDLVVVHMLEPVILDENGNVVKTGTILLGKKSE